MSATSQSSAAAALLRIGQSVLFAALLVLGAVRAVLAGGGWPVVAGAAAVAVLFGVGLVAHPRLGPAGRVAWVVALLIGTTALMVVSPDFVWLAFPVWMWVAQLLPLPGAWALTAASVAVVIVVLRQQGDSSSAAVLGPIIGALIAVGLARGALRLEREGEEHRRLLARVLEAQAEAAVLSDELVRAQREADLMSRFNLHTVLRLPNGVFAPYTIIPSNVLFFEKGKQGSVWFYEIPAPEGRKNYTKTKPMRFEEFADCAAWWGGRRRESRVENERAWRVDAATIRESGYNLDLHNPHRPDDLEHRSPKELVAQLIETERELLRLYEELEREIDGFAL